MNYPGATARVRLTAPTRNKGENAISIPAHDAASADIASLAREAGLERIHILAWRDLADVEAGGSELYLSRISELWAEAGLDVLMRTSHAQGQPPEGSRDGYRVVRRSGRYSVFPHTIVSEVLERHGPRDAIVETWNGVPYLSPVWFRGPKLIVLHHVHQNMWAQVLDPRLASFGKVLEGRIAPPFYKRVPFVTCSETSRDEITGMLGIPAANVTVAHPGIDPKFQPGVEPSEHPLIVSVGRLMPPKRFDEMIRIAYEVRRTLPDLELVIVGDGYERPKLQQVVHDLDAKDWVSLRGRVSDEELVWLYQRAWVTSNFSSAEGWGMTITEAAACGTPAVVSRIGGHQNAIAEGKSGLLADSPAQMVEELTAVLTDADLRLRLSEGARKHAARLTWEASALTAFTPLAERTIRSRARSGGTRPT